MIRFFDKATQTGTGDDGLPTYGMTPYFEAYKSAVTHVIRPARDSDRRSHPDAWAAYEATREPDHEGFPIAAWPQIDEADRKGLAERGIHTLEKLIETDLQSAPSELRDAQDRARAFLDQTHSEAPQLAARIAELEASETRLIDENKELRADLDAAEQLRLREGGELRADVQRLTDELAKAKAKPAEGGKAKAT